MILISDTFTQFGNSLMEKLSDGDTFCNSLEVAENGEITALVMRCEKSKLTTVHCSPRDLRLSQAEIPNDLGMIQAKQDFSVYRAESADHPEIPTYEEYDELLQRSEKQ